MGGLLERGLDCFGGGRVGAGGEFFCDHVFTHKVSIFAIGRKRNPRDEYPAIRRPLVNQKFPGRSNVGMFTGS